MIRHKGAALRARILFALGDLRTLQHSRRTSVCIEDDLGLIVGVGLVDGSLDARFFFSLCIARICSLVFCLADAVNVRIYAFTIPQVYALTNLRIPDSTNNRVFIK